MTNDQLLDDLKQFITATVSQQTADLATKDDINGLAKRIDDAEKKMATKGDLVGAEQRLTQRINGLDHKLDEVQSAVGDALMQVTDALDVTAQNKQLDRRINKLEKMAQIILIRGQRSAE